AQRGFIGQRLERFPCRDGHLANLAGIEVRHNDPRVSHASAIVALVESRLRGLEQKARRRSREIRVLQFLLGRRIECDGTERLRARPAVRSRNGDGFIKWTKRWRRRDFLQKLRRILFTWPKSS